MKHLLDTFVRVTLFIFILLLWSWVLNRSFSNIVNLSMIVGCVLLVLPIVWIGRKMLDKKPTISHTIWITTCVHYVLVTLFGIAFIRAIATHQDWTGWSIPIPTEIGLILVIVTGGAALLTVINLALKGLGAPFAIAPTEKLAVDWLYAWTRNPMVLATLAFLFALGIRFQSVLFIAWAFILVTPVLLIFVKVYEERELEIRFGASYLEYKAKTPMLFPKKPRRVDNTRK